MVLICNRIRAHDNCNFDIEKAAGLLSAMANINRLKALYLIIGREWDVGDLADAVGLSQSALSQHLKILRDFGIVRTRRRKQTIYYYCDSLAVIKVMEACDDNKGGARISGEQAEAL